jgi:hypothetical protein
VRQREETAERTGGLIGDPLIPDRLSMRECPRILAHDVPDPLR